MHGTTGCKHPAVAAGNLQDSEGDKREALVPIVGTVRLQEKWGAGGDSLGTRLDQCQHMAAKLEEPQGA